LRYVLSLFLMRYHAVNDAVHAVHISPHELFITAGVTRQFFLTTYYEFFV
jgi:hypothetical protein